MLVLHMTARLFFSHLKLYILRQARSWGGCRGVSKSLRSVSSTASTKKMIFNFLWKGYRGKAKKGQSLTARGLQHGNPTAYAPVRLDHHEDFVLGQHKVFSLLGRP